MVICNVERFLAEAIESVVGQTFKEFEFIILDFGSTDSSKAIAARYVARDSRIKLHEIPTCSLTEARNAACRLAQGQYIAVMDSDDIADPNRLLWQFEFMEKHPKVGLLGGATQWIDATGRFLDIHSFPTEHAQLKSELLTRCPFCQPTVLMRTKAFSSVGGYRRVFAQAEDYDLWIRIAESFEVANLEKVVLKYRIHPYQVSIRKRKQQTLCILAAQASAVSRSARSLDPMESIEEINPEVLGELGVSEATQQVGLASDSRDWVRNMIAAGEHAVALKAVVEILQSCDWKYVESWRIAELWLTAARLYWDQGRFASSLRAVRRAIVVRPAVLGRPLKPLLRWVGLV